MTLHRNPPQTAADILGLLHEADLPPARKRDLISAVNRVCELRACHPSALPLDIPSLRQAMAIKAAAHDISEKTAINLRSNFYAAMAFAGIVDPLPRGLARHDAAWAPLATAIAGSRYLSHGLATFMSWCVQSQIAPAAVDDEVVRRFAAWLEARTLHPRPRHIIWGVPAIWNRSRTLVPHWPATELARISFRPPQLNRRWEELPAGFRLEAEKYLELRRSPDLFEIHPHIPRRPLAASSLGLQREQIRLMASVLLREGRNVDALAALVEPEAVKMLLRHYHRKAGEKPNAFVNRLASTLIDVARYGVRLPDSELAEIKALAARLPPVRPDLTQKNRALLAQLESHRRRAKLLFLPDDLCAQAQAALARNRLPLVDAQIALAVAILLAAPVRRQNLVGLHWTQHFHEPDGAKGPLLILIPAAETKGHGRDLSYELPDHVAKLIRWYRREILPRVGAGVNGYLFVTQRGLQKDPRTVEKQLIQRIGRHVGIHMTPHQFRHLTANLYLEGHPEGMQVVSDFLGHSSSKSARIYAGSSSRRAGRAYNKHLAAARDALKLAGRKRGRRR